MSCKKCEEAIRETSFNKDGQPTFIKEDMAGTPQPMPIHYTYVRVGSADVLLSGCNKHMQQLVTYYNIGLQEETKNG